MAHLAPREIARDFIYLSSARIFALGISLVRTLFIPKLLGPAPYGMWKSLGIIQSYMQFSDMGALAALKREIPLHESRGHALKAGEARDVAFFVNNLAVVVAAVGSMAGSFLVPDPIYARALRLFILVLFARQVNNFLEKLLFWRKDFAYASKISLILSLLESALAIAGTWLYGLDGLILGTFLGYAAVVVLQLRRIAFGIGLRFRWAAYLELIRIGFPSHVNGLLYNIFTSIDRLLILPVLGLEGLGIYGLAMTLNEYLFRLSYAFGNVISPRLVERFGKSESVADLRPLVEKPTLAIAVAAPALLGVVFIAIGPAVELVLPEFAGAVTPMRVLLVGTFFSSLHRGLSSFFLTIRKQARLFPVYGAAIAANAALVWTALQQGMGVNGVAVAGSTVMAAFSISLIVMARWLLSPGISGQVKYLAGLMLPLAWGALSVWAAGELAARTALPGLHPLAGASGEAALFVLLYSPAIFTGYRALRPAGT